MNSELGIKQNKTNNKKFLFESFESRSVLPLNYDDNGKCTFGNSNTHLIDDDEEKYYTKSQYLEEFKDNNEVISKIKTTKSLFIRILFFYLIYQLLIIIVIINSKYNNKNAEPIYKIHDKNDDMTYQCVLEKMDLLFYSLDIFVYITIFIRGKKIMNYNYIFVHTKYIVYLSAIGIAFGPIINVISNILQNQRYNKVIILTITNSLCYFAMFILFSWEKVYYIIKKEGNNPFKYFIFIRNEECLKHKSHTCGCYYHKSSEEIRSSIDNYLFIYKICSSIFEISEGRIKFITLPKVQKQLRSSLK